MNRKGLYWLLCGATLFAIYFMFCIMYVWAFLDPSDAFLVYINMFNEKWVEGPLFLLTFPGILNLIGRSLLKEVKADE